jgi:hypothetical protein
MSEAAASSLPVAHELVRRYAEKDGRRVVLMRCFDFGAHAQVACDVYPAGGPADEPTSAGPYVFRTASEAMRFVEEAALALRYLGCEIT